MEITLHSTNALLSLSVSVSRNQGRFECVRELLARNADPLAEDHHGDTPLSVARDRVS